MRTSSVCVLLLAFSCAIISSDAAKKKPEVEAKVTQKVFRQCWLAQAQVSGLLGIQSDHALISFDYLQVFFDIEIDGVPSGE